MATNQKWLYLCAYKETQNQDNLQKSDYEHFIISELPVGPSN